MKDCRPSYGHVDLYFPEKFLKIDGSLPLSHKTLKKSRSKYKIELLELENKRSHKIVYFPITESLQKFVNPQLHTEKVM